MARDKLGLIPFSLTLVGLVTYIKTENITLFVIGMLGVLALIFTKSKFVT